MSDEILHLKPNLESCYMAAQTMRTKIQSSFGELPDAASRTSLRDSLLQHVDSLTEDTTPVIVMQLSLAAADLVLQMPEWANAVQDLIARYCSAVSYSGICCHDLVIYGVKRFARHKIRLFSFFVRMWFA